MILETIVTTLAPGGTLNVAPMGPEVGDGPSLARFTLRPYKTSTTYKNLKARGEGVLHVTDDVLLIARAAISKVEDAPGRPASKVRGVILDTPGRYHEFRVLQLDDRADRTAILAETVAEGRQARDLLGLNRARHAVVEAAILATRLDFLPPAEVQADFARLAILVEKTGGEDERRAFGILEDHRRRHHRHGPSARRETAPGRSTSSEEAKATSGPDRFPPGWDEDRVRRLLKDLDRRTDDEWVAADEAAAIDPDDRATVTVPRGLLPEVRRLIAAHKPA